VVGQQWTLEYKDTTIQQEEQAKKKQETMEGSWERGKLNLTHKSKHHHPSHIDSPPPPLACILPPLFARPLLIHINSHNLFKKLLKK